MRKYPEDHWNREQDPERAIAKYDAIRPHLDEEVIFEKIIDFDLFGRTVLDYGCGIGYFSIELAKRGSYVTGVDISEEAINTATYYARREGVEDRCCFYQCGNEFGMLQKLGIFDVIFIKDIIEHIEEDERFMSLLVPHLKKYGPMVVTTPNPISIGHLIGVIYNRWYRNNTDWVGGADETHVRLYSTLKLKSFLKKYGLKREKVYSTNLIPGDIIYWLTLFRKDIPFSSNFLDRLLGCHWPFFYFGGQQLNLFRRIST
jgi:2-polyprenyl-3-methyl-5-hydroxy-6-metoxy-1,4-benzoquinol methylase